MLAFGLIDGAETVSLAKTVLDRDVVTMIERFVRDDPIDATRALTADIRSGGRRRPLPGDAWSTRTFLHPAGELWSPWVFQRAPLESYRGRSLVQDAADQARELVGGRTRCLRSRTTWSGR